VAPLSRDGYGEHEDGRAYDAPASAAAGRYDGERGHYELCAGNDPLPYLEAMRDGEPGGMLPEQVWEPTRSPRAFCFPAGQRLAMPLAWAHANSSSSWCRGRSAIRSAARARSGSATRASCTRNTLWCRTRRSAGLPPARAWRSLYSTVDRALGPRRLLATMDMPTSDAGLGFHVAVLDTAA